MAIQQLVFQLALKHNFSMLNVMDALWVEGPAVYGTLVIALRDGGDGYVVARSLRINNRDVTGFRVYYDKLWQPVVAINEKGEIVTNPEKADEVMCSLIENVFVKSEQAWIRSREYSGLGGRV